MKTKFKIFAIFVLTFAACKKEQKSIPPNEGQQRSITLSISDAIAYIERQKQDPDSGLVLNELEIDWKNAQNRSTKNGNIWKINLKGQPTYQNVKQGYRQLVILRNPKTDEMETRILEVIPDAIYLQKAININPGTFTGRIYNYNLNYKLIGGQLYSEGKQVGEIGRKENFTQQNQRLKDLSPLKGIQGKAMMLQVLESCAWYQDSYVDAYGDFTVHSERVCGYSVYDDGINWGGGGGGINSYESPLVGGGGSSISDPTPDPPRPSNLPGENNNTVDPKKMMKCFSAISDPNAAYVVKVYVVEPQPGTSFNVGTNSFGHVAISLSKTSGSTTITQTIGFYPTGTGLAKLDSKSQVLDNGFTEYNISSTYYVDNYSFQKVINYVSNPPTQYHFTDFNCSAFVYAAGQAGGIPIPDPTIQIGISGPGGVGYAKTPAGMASALRMQKANIQNSDIDEGGGTVPASKGPCN